MNLTAHLPVLLVVVPLLAAPLTVLLRRRSVAFALVLGASWLTLALAIALHSQVQAHGVVSYAIGNWAPPWGIEYRVDRLSSYVLILICAIASVVLPYSRASIEAEIEPQQHYLFYTMFALCLTGLLGMTVTGDAFNIFVFLEISSLATYVMVALAADRRALLAAYQYLIMGTIGATFVVIGVGLLYLMTGTLNLADMAERLVPLRGTRPVLAALAFLTVGLSIKAAVFPLHQWLPNAYAYAPSAVTAFVAGTATKVALYVLMRYYFTVFGETQVLARLPMQQMLLVLALAGMFGASTVAIFQTDLKRLFAYSSVAQVGYIILGLSFGSATGLAAGIVHLFNHAVTKGAIFMLLGAVTAALGGAGLARIQGLGRTMPWASLGIVICGLSLIGVPGTAGFISKWVLVQAALERRQWWLVFMIVGSSLLAIVYVWRFVEAAYFGTAPADAPPPARLRWQLVAPSAVLVAATVYFGIDTSFTLDAATAAANQLLGTAR